MTSATCAAPGCPTPRPQGAYLCRSCVRALRGRLNEVEALYGELSVTFARLDMIGPGGQLVTGPAPLPYKPHAREAMAVLRNVLSTWAWLLVADIGMAPRYVQPSAWLARHLDQLAAHPDAGQAYDEITDAVALGWRTIDRPPELLLAGVCNAPTGDGRPCRTTLYARPYDVAVSCPDCRTTHDVTERRAEMVESAKDTLVTHTVALGWVRLLLDRTVAGGTWRSWRSRRRLVARGTDMSGRALYRFGDVYDLATGSPGARVA